MNKLTSLRAGGKNYVQIARSRYTGIMHEVTCSSFGNLVNSQLLPAIHVLSLGILKRNLLRSE